MNYHPPWWLNNGLVMTVYTAWFASKNWEKKIIEEPVTFQKKIFKGYKKVPIFGKFAIPKNPKATIVATYGITGDLENQWFLQIMARKAYDRGFAVVIFDWRAHGITAKLSPTLTSDGINEGRDYGYIASQAKQLGCPAPFWFTGYSLGGKLSLWGIYYNHQETGLNIKDIAGGAVICPSLDAQRSLKYLMNHPWKKYIEKEIAKTLKKLARQLHEYHPDRISKDSVEKANTIWDFDTELVIPTLGFDSVEDYYTASSPLNILPKINKPTLIIYAEDDPLFDPSIINDLIIACDNNSFLNLLLTKAGGHVGYISSENCQEQYGDSDRWWAINRILDWFDLDR